MEIITRLGIKIIVCYFTFSAVFFFAFDAARIEVPVFETQLQNCIKPNVCQSVF